MKFVIDCAVGDPVEINTLAELKAFALGGSGRVYISYVEHNPLTGEKSLPIIRREQEQQEE